MYHDSFTLPNSKQLGKGFVYTLTIYIQRKFVSWIYERAILKSIPKQWHYLLNVVKDATVLPVKALQQLSAILFYNPYGYLSSQHQRWKPKELSPWLSITSRPNKQFFESCKVGFHVI